MRGPDPPAPLPPSAKTASGIVRASLFADFGMHERLTGWLIAVTLGARNVTLRRYYCLPRVATPRSVGVLPRAIRSFALAKNSFRCRLVTPTASLVDEDVTYASIPAW